jgi:hypothetical protein
MIRLIFTAVSFFGSLILFSFGWALSLPLFGCAAVLGLLELQERGIVGR